MREPQGRVLVVGAEAEVMRQVVRIAGGPNSPAIEWVSGAAEAIDLLGRSANDIVLVLADQRLSDGTPYDVFRYVRRDPDCPFPGTALALSGEALTEGDVRRSAILGCLHFLQRPFLPEAVLQGFSQWPLDRTDFIVSGSYSGPDRRRGSRQQMVERRTVSGPAEQTVASTSLGFEIRPSTTVFRFRRLPTADRDPALALRNGLSRETVDPARAHIRLKKEQALAMLGHTLHRMEEAYAGLTNRIDREGLKRLNVAAREAAALTETRGLLLIGTIVRGLIGHSAGGHPPGAPLLALLRAHVDALTDALARGIVDDGGPAGRQILGTLRSAEEAFAARVPAPAGGMVERPH